MGLHVDDRADAPERGLRGGEIVHRHLGHRVEAAAVCGVDRDQRRRSSAAVSEGGIAL